MKSKKEWPPELLQRMYQESRTAMRMVLEHLAARPDTWVPYGELNEAITSEEDRKVGELSWQLGPFTSRCRERYGMGWPFEKGLSPTPGEGMRYRMDARVAERIRAYARAPRQSGS
ncbi:MAG: hypothetical protein M3R38_01900 [Actinomycetota bacterium]|nr:hypothetical protein [Actinomycetota bacterium]